ncbi:hypothetical protein FQA39_LY09188 [Lamprigera yunnana]|nr:hypothetical protein FQA39_LY09188 [Lamprigera yunnana]
MELVSGFFDYNVSDKCVTGGNFQSIAKCLYEFGYHTIAINQTVDEASFNDHSENKKKKKIDKTDIVPVPLQVKEIEGCGNLKVLNRLTIVFTNQDIINRIVKSPNFKKYHIIAAQPDSQQAFQTSNRYNPLSGLPVTAVIVIASAPIFAIVTVCGKNHN